MSQGHEVHISCALDSPGLDRLRAALPELQPNDQCDPANVPPNTICFEYPRGREREFEGAAAVEGIAYEWGVVGFAFTCVKAVGDYLYAGNEVGFLWIWDISDPETPVAPAGFAPLDLTGDGTGLRDLAIYRGVCYCLAEESIFTVNIDDPATPTLLGTETQAGENWQRIVVVGDTIFVSGNHIGLIDTGVDTGTETDEHAFAIQDEPSQPVAGIAVQGRRLYEVESSGGFLRGFRIGGFACPHISTGSLAADEVSTELLRARYGYFKGEVVASGLTVLAGEDEPQAGTGAFAIIKLGAKFIIASETVPDPNTFVTAPKSSLFLASDGTVWRNTDDATAWTAV